MTVRTRNRLITFSILAGPFVFLLCLLLFWDAEPLPPVPALPNPNGYEELVKAGNMVSNDFDNYDELSSATLRELIKKNAEAFQTARTGLQGECRVPLDYSATSSAHLDQLAALKRLAFGFIAEGRLAEKENRASNAAQFYLDTINLGNKSARGGVLIDQLVGTALEAIGVANLQKLVDDLDAKTCRETAATLETLDSQRQTWDEVMQQERDWSRRTFPGICNELARLMSRKTLNKAYQMAEQKFNEQRIKTRQLILEFAARAYQLDKGHPPANLTDLVPDYLKAIPQDPLTGTNIVYTPR
ncbi:MAG TPA: hypothetical protein VG077_02275 [Verrucomicrobiae bacterium]|nr:hypothetical protein [Verrucomicrobiae bacterium]